MQLGVSLLSLLTISLTGRDISPSCLLITFAQKKCNNHSFSKDIFSCDMDMVYFYSAMSEIFLTFLIKDRKLYLYNDNPFINGVI